MQTLKHFFSRIRRNHALEHATIHVLNERFPQLTLMGRSDGGGFFLYADLSAEAVISAAQEALQRLRAGEKDLAVHPNCGTTVLATGALSGAGAYLSLVGLRSNSWRDRIDRLPLAIMAAIVGSLLARPLGLKLQERLTTDAHPRGLEIQSIHVTHRGNGTLFRVLTTG